MQEEVLMNHDLNHATHLLRKGGLFRVDDGQGRRIECVGGTLWLTQQDDPRDVVLTPGQAFTIDRAGATYLNALGDSSFMVLDPSMA
jgi:Protein of unknown function (DUF2917)